MASINAPSQRPAVHTHEGARAVHNPTALAELRRTSLAALLFEDLFYESGSAHAARVVDLVGQCAAEDVAALAIEARERMHLRHLPLFLACELALRSETGSSTSAHGTLVRQTVARVIQRPDELAEFLAMRWRDRAPKTMRTKNTRGLAIPRAALRGMADAFGKFTPYALAKYRDDDKTVKLRDALRLCRPKATTPEQAETFKALRAGTLKAFDTWETELSAGKDKREVFERLLREKKLGGLAFLRNLRTMAEAEVDVALITAMLREHPFTRVLPFRFLAAAPFAPGLVTELGDAMERVLNADAPRLPGQTAVLIDVSQSMTAPLSSKSDLSRMDAACGVAILARGRCADVRVYTFSEHLVQVPSYRGLALRDAILRSQPYQNTYLGRAVSELNAIGYDRLIVFTDEQSHDPVGAPKVGALGYMINVAAYQHGVGFGPWTRVDGFSERVLDFVEEAERAGDGR